MYVITNIVGRASEFLAPAAGPVPPALYVGAPIAAVAAITPEAAEAALSLIKIEYQVLPFVVDMEGARKPDAPMVFRLPSSASAFPTVCSLGRRLRNTEICAAPPSRERGDVNKGFAEADVGRRRVPHAGADALLHGNPFDRRRLAGGWLDRLSLDPVHRRRARRIGRCLRAAAQSCPRRNRFDGRRIRFEI